MLKKTELDEWLSEVADNFSSINQQFKNMVVVYGFSDGYILGG